MVRRKKEPNRVDEMLALLGFPWSPPISSVLMSGAVCGMG
jgi:hypothetical protein